MDRDNARGECHYVVLFDRHSPIDESGATVSADTLEKWPGAQPLGYGLDPNVALSVPVLWFCLQLPRSLADLERLSAGTLCRLQQLDLPHRITLVPTDRLEFLEAVIGGDGVNVLFVPPGLADGSLGKHRDAFVAVLSTSELDGDSGAALWRLLATELRPRRPLDTELQPPAKSTRCRGTALAGAWVARHFGDRLEWPVEGDCENDAALEFFVELQVHLHTVNQLEQDNLPVDDGYAEKMSAQWPVVRFPVSVVAPGTSPRSAYRQIDQSRRGGDEEAGAVRASDERATLGVLGAHRAIARSGVAVELDRIQDSAFETVDRLEQMWASSRGQPPAKKVWRALTSLAEDVRRAGSLSKWGTIARASEATVFSDFPLGLATLEGDTAPLCCRVPMSYRSLTPLTRAMQLELSSPGRALCSNRFRVLIAECVPGDQLVGRLSRGGWEVALEGAEAMGGGQITIRETLSVDAVRRALDEQQYDALVLSAHGWYDKRRRVAGVLCGEEVVLDQSLGRLPPLVVLSACHVWPRGRGAVSIADLLFKQGALAVAGTLVPVDVRRNATFMVRCFVNVAETLAGRSDCRNFAEVWHKTTSQNAIHDIISGNRQMEAWACAGASPEETPIWDFKMRRAPGRLRQGHVYRDSEELILEIAEEQGIGQKCRAWLASPGYVPETAFYALLGFPEKIAFGDRTVEL